MQVRPLHLFVSVVPWFFHLNSVHSLPLLFLTFSRFRHPPTAFQSAGAFNADISKWNTGAVTTMRYSTSTPPSCFCCPLLLSLEFRPLIPVMFSRFYLFLVVNLAPTSSYSILRVGWVCIQRGHFQVEHCGGDEHGWKYVHSTLFVSVVASFS